jgi:hypothetical protein
LLVNNSTISRNIAYYDGQGGGLFGPATLENTIMFFNTPNNCYGTVIDGGGNLSWPDTTCPGLHANPMLGPLQFNGGPTPTLALLPGSPAIDAGLNSNCVRTDQRGYPRPVDGNGDHQPVCDIGAYEYNAYVLQSPSFEQGSDIGWTQFSNTGQELITMTRPHTGQYSAELCGRNGCMDSIQQQVTIPYNGQLRFWWYMSTQEETAEAHDGLQVQLITEDGHTASVARHTNQDIRDTWVQDMIDVSQAAGQTVTLRFTARTDGSLPTTFWVDDVVLR